MDGVRQILSQSVVRGEKSRHLRGADHINGDTREEVPAAQSS